MVKKSTGETTLAEHAASIAGLGGKARAKKLSKQRIVEIARLGGQSGGAARAAALTSAQRSEIAKKAAAARWAGKAKKKK